MLAFPGCWYQNELPKLDVFSDALYTIDIGQNDLANGFRKLPIQQVPAIIPSILAQLSYIIQVKPGNILVYFFQIFMIITCCINCKDQGAGY